MATETAAGPRSQEASTLTVTSLKAVTLPNASPTVQLEDENVPLAPV